MTAAETGVVARLFVPGRPRTKGSLKPIHQKMGGGRCKVSLTEDHALSTPWKKTMIRAIIEARRAAGRGLEAYTGPVEVHCFFRFEREKSVRLGAGSGVLQEHWPSHATDWPTAPDIGDEDKLRRNVLDALTQSHLLADDALVVGGANYKRWVRPEEEPGVLIVVAVAREPWIVEYLERQALAREL